MDLISQFLGIPAENLKVLSWILLAGLSFKLGSIHAARVSMEKKFGLFLGLVTIAGSYVSRR
jgi:hypothetical protein